VFSHKDFEIKAERTHHQKGKEADDDINSDQTEDSQEPLSGQEPKDTGERNKQQNEDNKLNNREKSLQSVLFLKIHFHKKHLTSCTIAA